MRGLLQEHLEAVGDNNEIAVIATETLRMNEGIS